MTFLAVQWANVAGEEVRQVLNEIDFRVLFFWLLNFRLGQKTTFLSNEFEKLNKLNDIKLVVFPPKAPFSH